MSNAVWASTQTTTGGLAPLQYKWWVYNGVTWSTVKDWSASDSFSRMPGLGGNYLVGVWVKSDLNPADVPEGRAYTSIPAGNPSVTSSNPSVTSKFLTLALAPLQSRKIAANSKVLEVGSLTLRLARRLHISRNYPVIHQWKSELRDPCISLRIGLVEFGSDTGAAQRGVITMW